MAKTYFVRLKPFNKKRGYLVRNYLYRGIRFTTRWKEVSAAKAEELQHLVQPHDPEEEIPLFDIKTKDEALVIEETERETAMSAKQVSKVKAAEKVPDRSFRDDRPKFDEDSGEILEGNVEPGETVGDQDEPEPAPPIKTAKKRSKRAGTRK